MALVLKRNKEARAGFLGWIPARVIKALAFGQLVITLPVLAFVVLGFTYIAEFRYQDPPVGGFNFYKTFDKTRQAITNFRFPLLRILGYNPEFQDVYIDIKQKHYRKLEFASWHDLQERASTTGVNPAFSRPRR